MKLELFSVPFFIGNIDLKKIKLEAEMGNAFTSQTPSSISETNIFDTGSETYLLEVIANLLGEKFSQFSIALLNIWRNKYLNNDFQEPHVHIGSKFSFIIYEKVSTPHTIFFNPAKYLITSTLNGQECVLQQFTPSVRKGQIIVFPSYIEHMVNRNSDQVTISGNLEFKFDEMIERDGPKSARTEVYQIK